MLDLRDTDIVDTAKNARILAFFLPIDPREMLSCIYTHSVRSIISLCQILRSLSALDQTHHGPSLYFNTVTRVARTRYVIHAVLSDQLNLFLFPFYRYFLNIKLRWNKKKYIILNHLNEVDKELPLWGSKGSKEWKTMNHYKWRTKPIKASVLGGSELANEVEMLPFWVDRSLESLDFALIRMRIVPNPNFFVTNIMFPLLMIVSCSFSIFAIDFKHAYNRLGVSVIILLTCTAFQSVIAAKLPAMSSMMLIDLWICLAFLIQVLLVLSTSLVSALIQLDVDIDTVYLVDCAFGATLGAIWIFASVVYLSLNSNRCRDFYDRCCCHKMVGRASSNIRASTVSFNDWERKGDYRWLLDASGHDDWDVGYAKGHDV